MRPWKKRPRVQDEGIPGCSGGTGRLATRALQQVMQVCNLSREQGTPIEYYLESSMASRTICMLTAQACVTAADCCILHFSNTNNHVPTWDLHPWGQPIGLSLHSWSLAPRTAIHVGRGVPGKLIILGSSMIIAACQGSSSTWRAACPTC